MSSSSRARSRALIAAGAVAAVATLSLAGAAPAAAHVHVDADTAAPGRTAVLTFRVPGESENGSLTKEFRVNLPDVASARTELMPGWTARLDRDAGAGTVRAVTWTAAPDVGISAEQFGLFRVSVTLPDAASVTLPATQTYSDGTVVRWDQPPLPGGGEPEYPAPVLTLDAAAGAGPDDHHGASTPAAPATPPSAAAPAAAAPAEPVAVHSDDTARWLAGAALVLAAAGVAAPLFRGRRA